MSHLQSMLSKLLNLYRKLTSKKRCFYCKCRIGNDLEQLNMSYSYDVRGTTFGKPNMKNFHKDCAKKYWKETTKAFDDMDEVMNRNKYFQREKGMIGKYKDGDKEFGPVYAYWKRADIEGQFLFPPKGEELKALTDFHYWLEENGLKYKYESR